jgi:hypothetical protein
VAREHLAGYLGIARLIGADQPQTIASENGDETIEKKKGGQAEQRCGFRNFAVRRKPGTKMPEPSRSAAGIAGVFRFLGRYTSGNGTLCLNMAGAIAGTRFTFR